MGSQQEARRVLGELFIMGFSGLELEDSTSSFLSEAQIGGVILFSHNYENPAQTAELTNEIQECRTESPLWISVDHEGGKVQRFRRGFTRIPEAASIGALDSPKLAFDVTEMMAKELQSVGINLNFSPIADILTNPKNPVIGNRAYGTNEEHVSKMVTAVVRGHLLQGVQPCVKHFPGHGDTHVDSHFTLPKVETPLEVLRQREFVPFTRAFKSKCSMVMTAHILNPKLDAEFPATLSSYTLREILRKELRYSKIIISDDLEMMAITNHFGAEDAPRMALEAGCDLLIYRTEAAARIGYEALVKALEKRTLAPEIVLEAAERSQALKKEVLKHYQPVRITELNKKLATPENLALVQKIEDKASQRH